MTSSTPLPDREGRQRSIWASGWFRPGPIFANLPELPPGYHPRSADLEALRAILVESQQNTGILGRARIAGLRGMGGVGKTVLATALVHLPEVQWAFPYGIVWLSFGRAVEPPGAAGGAGPRRHRPGC